MHRSIRRAKAPATALALLIAALLGVLSPGGVATAGTASPAAVPRASVLLTLMDDMTDSSRCRVVISLRGLPGETDIAVSVWGQADSVFHFTTARSGSYSGVFSVPESTWPTAGLENIVIERADDSPLGLSLDYRYRNTCTAG